MITSGAGLVTSPPSRRARRRSPIACRPLNAEVSAAAATSTTLSSASSGPRHVQVHRPVERLAVHDVDQDQAHDCADDEARRTPIAPSAAPSNASIRPISPRVTPRWRSMPNSPRRASTCELVLALMPNRPISTATASSRYVTANVRSNTAQRQPADLARHGDLVVAARAERDAHAVASRRPGSAPLSSQSAAVVALRVAGLRARRYRAASRSRRRAARSRATRRARWRARVRPPSGRSNSVPTSQPAQVERRLRNPHRHGAGGRGLRIARVAAAASRRPVCSSIGRAMIVTGSPPPGSATSWKRTKSARVTPGTRRSALLRIVVQVAA